MAAELSFDVAPDALHQVQLRSVGRQPERTHPVVMRHPPVLGEPTLVVADIVQHDDHGAIRECGHEVIEEGDEGFPVLALAELPDDLARGVVERPEDGELAILPSRWDLHRTPSSLPHFCQVGMTVDFALVEVDQTQLAGGITAFFRSHVSTSSAAATAS